MEIIEGMLSLDAALKAGRRKVHRILLEQKRADRRMTETAYIKKQAQAKGIELRFVTSAEINSVVTGSTHGGIVAFVGEREMQTAEQLFAASAKFVCLLEGIEDPFNFGFTVRSLYCAGCDGLILPERSWITATSTVTRSSAGATEYMPTFAGDTVTAAKQLKDAGYKVICADIPSSQPLYSPSLDLSYPLLLVIGGEKRGISKPLLDIADSVVRIEYGRGFKGALPAVSAASVLAFEIHRRNMESR